MSKNPPLIASVCLPTHNAKDTIGDTLRSIVSQTYRDMDIVVLDNASTDGTYDIIESFARKDSRIRHLRFEELVHGHKNFTRAFAAAQGEVMAIYHADDVYHPTIVEEQVALLQKRPDIGAVFTNGRKIDSQGRPFPDPFPIPHSIFSGGFAEFDFTDAFRAVLQYGHIFLTPSGMARTAIYRDEIKKWPYLDFGGSGDLYVYLTIARAHKIAILENTLMDYRTTGASFRYARERRTRHDIFKTLTHFVDHGGAEVMRPRDKANYEFLQLKDDINIAVSCLIDGDRSLARKLMPRLVQPHIIAAALRYHRHAKFLLFGYAAWLLSFVPLGQTGRKALNKLRFG